jgi:predicted nucleotidyltransferase
MKTIDITLAILQDIFRKYPEIIQAKLYGSRAKGNYKTNSDYDLALFFKKDLVSSKKNSYVKIISAIKDALEQTSLPYLFDIQSYHEISNLELKKHIDRIGIVIFDQEILQSSYISWDSTMLNELIHHTELAHIIYALKQYPNVINQKQTKQIIDALRRFVVINTSTNTTI